MDLTNLRALWRELDTDEERTAFAARCGTTFGHMRNVVWSGKACGPLLAIAIERESGKRVMRWTLRDDWHVYWPELIGIDGAPAVPEKV